MLAEILQNSRNIYPLLPAISQDYGVVYTYNSLAEMVERLAGILQKKLKKNSRIGIFMQNNSDYFLILFAIWHAGMVAVPINFMADPENLEHIILNSEISLCFTDNASRSKVHSIKSDIALFIIDEQLKTQIDSSDPIPIVPSRENDLAWIFYTSGTTGKPKGALLTHKNISSIIKNFLEEVDYIREHNNLLHLSPISHGSGMLGLQHIAIGANNIIPSFADFDLEKVINLLKHYFNVNLLLSPSLIKFITLNSNKFLEVLKSVDTIFYGGAPLHTGFLKQALETFGPIFVQVYSLVEAPLGISMLKKQDHKRALLENNNNILRSVGKARAKTRVSIVSKAGQELKPFEVGEVVCNCEEIMAGYWKNEDATNTALKDNWLYTGDMGYLDNENFLYLQDRMSDAIDLGNKRIFSRDIEEIIATHPNVLEVAVVFYKPLSQIVAFIIPKKDMAITKEELTELYKKHNNSGAGIAIEFLEKFPINSYGKIVKQKLKELYVR